jgi:hypothetical protein
MAVSGVAARKACTPRCTSMRHTAQFDPDPSFQTGEIVHNMQSDTEGCSNLHLASGGRLLVGLVDILDAYESGGSTEGSAPEADRQLFQVDSRIGRWSSELT